MIILSDEKKSIKVEMRNKITATQNNHKTIYETQLPIIKSDDFESIAYIQQKVNELVNVMVHELIK